MIVATRWFNAEQQGLRPRRGREVRIERAQAALLLVFLLLLPACGGGGLPPDAGLDEWGYGPSIGDTSITVYLPYVEEVTLPDPIYANEDFVVTLRVSSVLEPRILRGDPESKTRRFFYYQPFPPSGPYDVLLETWMSPYLSEEGPLVDTMHYTCEGGLPEGEWTLGVTTSPSRELGGMTASYSVLEGTAWGADWETRLYPITVVNRPGGG